jgi:hypothetical protein
LKDALTCTPDELLANFSKLSLLPDEAKKTIKRKAGLNGSTRIEMAFLQQIRKIADWSNIDHLQLYKDLAAIAEFTQIDLNKIYKSFIFAKIENGLIFIELFGKISQSSKRPRGMVGMGDPSTSGILQNCYKVLTTDIHKEDPKY